jgi:hypothetical protein
MGLAGVEANDGRWLWSIGHKNALEQNAPQKGCVANPIGAIHQIGICAHGNAASGTCCKGVANGTQPRAANGVQPENRFRRNLNRKHPHQTKLLQINSKHLNRDRNAFRRGRMKMLLFPLSSGQERSQFARLRRFRDACLSNIRP